MNALLFDIGNVILEVDFHSSLRRLLPAGTNARAVLEQLLARKDDYRHLRDPGGLPVADRSPGRPEPQGDAGVGEIRAVDAVGEDQVIGEEVHCRGRRPGDVDAIG